MTDFLELHHRDGPPLLLPNPWDVGSARLLESLGFEALATTSSGFAVLADGAASSQIAGTAPTLHDRLSCHMTAPSLAVRRT